MKNVWVFWWGCLIGILGGLIGLGGAEFRLPVLVGIFKYRIKKTEILKVHDRVNYVNYLHTNRYYVRYPYV